MATAQQLINITRFFKVKERNGDIPVKCPFHEDRNPSASLNFQKGLFKCHSKSCNVGFNFKQLFEHIDLFKKGEKNSIVSSQYTKNNIESYNTVAEKNYPSNKVSPTPPALPSKKLSNTSIKKLASEEFSRRGLTLAFIKKHVDVNFSSGSTNASVIFSSPNATFACGKKLYGDGPKYKNVEFNKLSEFKSLFPLKTYDPDSNIVWLVEGIFDALALTACGISNCIALLTNTVTEENLFPLRGKTVFICLDSDYPGWNGTKELGKVLTELDCNVIPIQNLHFANDPSDGYANHKKEFVNWLNKQLAQFSLDDAGYIGSFTKGEERPLQVISTGIKLLDSYYGGGYKDGVHLIASEPGVGKTSYICFFSTQYKLRSKKKLLCTYEIPKSQYWARNASSKSKHIWSKIELDPTILEPDVKKWLKSTAKNLRVVTGWNVQKIRHVAKDFDIIIIDYLQRMPSPIARGLDPSGRAALEYNIETLANLARDLGKVIIVASSLSRMGQFRGSGVIEFIVQSSAYLRGIDDDDEGFDVEAFTHPELIKKRRLIWDINKNTRGYLGKINLEVDLGHIKFEEC